MAKFWRFEFKATEPAETYEGDFMTADDKFCVRIFRGEESKLNALSEPHLVAMIRVSENQSVREMESPEQPETGKRSQRTKS